MYILKQVNRSILPDEFHSFFGSICMSFTNTTCQQGALHPSYSLFWPQHKLSWFTQTYTYTHIL